MTKKLLNGAKIGTMSKQMCGKGVTKRVRCHMRRKAELEAKRLHQPLRRARAEAVAAAADKQR